jgi:sugar O-acyltransferase (sialic acid O-acetyltransferase NeuD family)
VNLPVILIGAGGHAKVILDVLMTSGQDVIGVVDPGLVSQGETAWRGIPVLGDDAALAAYPAGTVALANGIGSVPGNTRRAEIYHHFRHLGYTFATLVHPSVVLATGVELQQGVQIMAGCILQPDVTVGENTLINTACRIDHDCIIGPDCHLAPGVVFSGAVTVGKNCHIGTGAIAVLGTSIGDNAVLGAGTVLRVHLPASRRLLGAKPQAIDMA